MFKKECLKRAVRTFGQAFAGVIVADVAAGVDLTNIKGVIQLVIIPAVAAGISAVMNMQRKNTHEEE